MALLLSVPSGLVGGQVALSSPPTGQVLSPVVELFSGPNPAFGLQTAWAINPGTGNDTGPGTPADPLRTMEEFNRRLSGNVLQTSTTLQLVGDVTDQPLMLAGTRFLTGVTLQVSGTVTAVGTPSVSLVTTLQAGCTFQLTTTGIVWTSGDVGKRIQLPAGELGWVQEFVDANNVVTGPFSSTSAPVTPVSGVSVTVQTLSAAFPPQFNCLAARSATSGTVGSSNVTVQHLTFSNAAFQVSGIGMLFFGCAMAGGQYFCGINANMRACLFTALTLISGAGQLSLNAHTCASAQIQIQGGLAQFSASSFQASSLVVSRLGFCANGGAMHFRNTASPIVLSQGGHFTNQNFAISGSVGNTGFGVNVRAGCLFTYLIAGTKPTVTGASGDTKIGATTRTYAQIPYTDLQLDAAPPVATLLIGSPACMTLEN